MGDEFIKVTKVEEEKDFSINNNDLDLGVVQLVQQKSDIQSKVDGIAVKMVKLRKIGANEIELKGITNKVNSLFARMNDDIDELKKIDLEIDNLLLKVSSKYQVFGIGQDYSKRHI